MLVTCWLNVDQWLTKCWINLRFLGRFWSIRDPPFFQCYIFSHIRVQIGREFLRLITLFCLNKFFDHYDILFSFCLWNDFIRSFTYYNLYYTRNLISLPGRSMTFVFSWDDFFLPVQKPTFFTPPKSFDFRTKNIWTFFNKNILSMANIYFFLFRGSKCGPKVGGVKCVQVKKIVVIFKSHLWRTYKL